MQQVPWPNYLQVSHFFLRVFLENVGLVSLPLWRLPEPVLGTVLAGTQASLVNLAHPLLLEVQVMARRTCLLEPRKGVSRCTKFPSSRGCQQFLRLIAIP